MSKHGDIQQGVVVSSLPMKHHHNSKDRRRDGGTKPFISSKRNPQFSWTSTRFQQCVKAWVRTFRFLDVILWWPPSSSVSVDQASTIVESHGLRWPRSLSRQACLIFICNAKSYRMPIFPPNLRLPSRPSLSNCLPSRPALYTCFPFCPSSITGFPFSSSLITHVFPSPFLFTRSLCLRRILCTFLKQQNTM